MRVLVVEDSERLADTLKDVLMKAGYMVDVAGDGQSGYENAVSGIYDIIILDLMLPKMNGYEVLSAIREEGHEVPVLILSAKTELDDKVDGFALGADDYVTKPFEMRELLMRIGAILRRKKGQGIVSLKAGNLELNTTTCKLTNIETGRAMKIAGKELQLLEFFLLRFFLLLRQHRHRQRPHGGQHHDPFLPGLPYARGGATAKYTPVIL